MIFLLKKYFCSLIYTLILNFLHVIVYLIWVQNFQLFSFLIKLSSFYQLVYNLLNKNSSILLKTNNKLCHTYNKTNPPIFTNPKNQELTIQHSKKLDNFSNSTGMTDSLVNLNPPND